MNAEDTGPDACAAVLMTNVAAPFLTVRAFLPQVEAAKGRIAIISSVMGSSGRAYGGSYLYCASKAGATNVARNLARELAPRGIAVGAYHPGWVQTDMGGPSAAISPEESARPSPKPVGGRRPSGEEGDEKMADSVFMAELSWPEYKAKVAAGVPVFLPLGATEQHGPHMAMNVDVVLPTAVCERVAREVGGLVAPTIPYGYKSMPRSGGGEQFPGTTSLDGHTFALVVRDVIRGLGRDGVRGLVVINGHFENMWPGVEGVDLGLRELQRDGIADMRVMRLEYWDFVRRETLDKLFPDGFPGTELEHASLLETSLMLLLRPELVNMAKVRQTDRRTSQATIPTQCATASSPPRASSPGPNVRRPSTGSCSWTTMSS